MAFNSQDFKDKMRYAFKTQKSAWHTVSAQQISADGIYSYYC